jgi:hypothetical protein
LTGIGFRVTVAPVAMSAGFERLAGVCALFVGLGALVYAILFITIVEGNTETEPWFAILLLGALTTVPVMIALYFRLRAFDPAAALTVLVLGLFGALGGILHGGYELAALVTTPNQGYYPGVEAVAKGVLRYLVAGLALLVLAWLVWASGLLPRGIALLAAIGGVLLIFIYIGRLFDFITPGDYVSLIPPIVYGFAVHPLLYAWIGLTFLRSPMVAAETRASL